MIDCTKEMIVLKGEIKTSSVKLCQYNPNTRKWDVTFNNGKLFSYANENVEIIRNPSLIDLNEYCLQEQGHMLIGIKEIYSFSGRKRNCYHVVYKNGYTKDYRSSEVRLVKSAFKTEKSKELREYFNRISEISNLRSEDGELLLKKQFEKIDFVAEDNALAPYLNAQCPKTKEVKPLIFPFGCNNSQYTAVENAMHRQLSVIQGPPGTGKTQTILNIIANIIAIGQTVQIVSNNNSAIENIQEKLSSPECNLDFIVAKLGKNDNKKQFVFSQVSEYPDFTNWEYKGNICALQAEILFLSRNLKKVYSNEEQIAKLNHEMDTIHVEKVHFEQCVKETGIVIEPFKIKESVKSSDIMILWQECLDSIEKRSKISAWRKIKWRFYYGIKDRFIYKKEVSSIIASIQALFYDKRIEEINYEIDKLKTEIDELHVDTDELRKKSMQYLRHIIKKRYVGRTNRKIFTEDDFWRNPYEVIFEYPVTLSTTFASKSSLGSRINIVQYNYLIMDEASQVDVATGVLALSSALNGVIVGDSKQLPNVITEDDRKMAENIFSQYDIPEGYKYTKSFLQSVLEVIPDIPATLLREHYRCHPKIINFCNQKYYDEQLVVMTHDNGEKNVIKAITTVAGNHERDHFNQRQIDVIKLEILPELEGNLSDVGIITPYRNQVEAIRREIPDVDINTVHKFQGREKDTIIISTVDDQKNDFSDDPYLINVAVSRAKKHLYVIASGNESGDGNINDLISYIRYNNCEVTESKVNSIFDYLYNNYTEARMQYLKNKKRVSEYDSENLMYSVLEDSLRENNREDIGIVSHTPLNLLLRDRERMTEEETKYAMNPLTHLDFVLYNRINKKILAAIEVDGYAFHKKNARQSVRDQLKDSIFEKYGVPLMRFSTTGSGEKERLKELLLNLK